MRRSSWIAAFSLILISMPLLAQRGGGGGHAAGGHGFSGHGFSGSSGSIHGGSFRSGSYARNSGVRIRTGSPYYGRRGFYGRGIYYPYVGYYPYGYYDWYDDSSANTQDQDAYASAPYPAPYPEDSGLQRDVEALNGKIDRLQADVEARNRPKPEEQQTTALVFRDNHVEEVRNYAISGGTLWVLNEKAAKKIPLAQLDIPATVRKNDDRGVDFQVPEPSLQIMITR
jgi:hypothetical protein